ncbi:MAG: 30S ribosomal protein S19 [Methanomassiliicoccales archaeon]|nr:MAG: 30S ribosomal protein S19 [Methanomassiliicoccales archaeon]
MADEKLTGTKSSRRKMRKKKTAITARRKKEFTYRGFTMEQLQEMPFEEVLELMPSRIRRTFIRGFNDEQRTAFEKIKSGKYEIVRTHRRDIPIVPEFVGRKVAVYNGKEFKEIEIRPEMIGHYLGEFSQTRKSVKHSGPGVGATRSSKFLPLK